MPAPTYSDWSLAERHAVAVARLKYAEQEHFRNALREDDPNFPEDKNVKHFEKQIEKLQSEVKDLEGKAKQKGVKLKEPKDVPAAF